MEKILLITDAANDLTPEAIAGKPIAVVPATVCFGGKTYKEFFDLRPQDYWPLLEKLDEIPATQMATPVEFLECYHEAVRQGYTHAIVSPVSGSASGVLATASIAYDMMKEESEPDFTVEFIDSRGYSMIYGRIILEVAEMIAGGAAFAEAVQGFRDRVARSEALFMVYSLKHIRKSGRIGGMSAFVGEAMGLRPILRCVDGTINPIEKVRGEKKLIPRMLELVRQFCVDPAGQVIYIVYAKVAAEEIDRAESEIRRAFSPLDVVRYPISVSVSTNTGPHCVGVIYYGASRNDPINI